MINNNLYLVFLAFTLTFTIWFNFWVVPKTAVVTVLDKNPNAELHGYVLAQMSSNHNSGYLEKSYMIRRNDWRNVELASGWDGVKALMPLAIVIVFISGVTGAFLGWYLRGLDAEEIYIDQINELNQKVALSNQKAFDSFKLSRELQNAMQRSIKWVKNIENTAAAKITSAENCAAYERELRLEAERKLEKERIEHKRNYDKMAARFSEHKRKLNDRKKEID